MLNGLKVKVYNASKRLRTAGLGRLPFGVVSEIDRETGLFAIRPEKVPLDKLTPDDMVVVDLTGEVVEGTNEPSAEFRTHVELYSVFEEIGGIAVTHSPYAAAFAQAGRDIPVYGAVHAFGFYGDVPCVHLAKLADDDFELGCAEAMISCMEGCDPLELPAVLVHSFGAYTFGRDGDGAVDNAVFLEEVARLALYTELLDPDAERVDERILEHHFMRKNGKLFDN